MDEPNDSQLATIFNQGCDARLAGQPKSDNPYPDDTALRQWLRGWQHVNQEWGAGAKWPVKLLPAVASYG